MKLKDLLVVLPKTIEVDIDVQDEENGLVGVYDIAIIESYTFLADYTVVEIVPMWDESRDHTISTSLYVHIASKESE